MKTTKNGTTKTTISAPAAKSAGLTIYPQSTSKCALAFELAKRGTTLGKLIAFLQSGDDAVRPARVLREMKRGNFRGISWKFAGGAFPTEPAGKLHITNLTGALDCSLSRPDVAPAAPVKSAKRKTAKAKKGGRK